MTDWIEKPLAEVAKALRVGRVSAAALLDEARACHARWDGRLGPYKTWDEDGARARARAADAAFQAGVDLGPLQGIPVSVKDLFALAGLPTYAGSPRRLPPAWERAGPVMVTLCRQMAVVTGKTHMVEFAFGGLGVNGHWGTPRNPWDATVHRVPGGSSSGAGVSLVEGSALLAFGSDTAGSVRIPASMAGNAGLKISHGRWSLDGIVPLSPAFDTPGLLARTVADLAHAFHALDPACRERGQGPLAPPADFAGLRVGRVEGYFWDGCSAGVAEADAYRRANMLALRNTGAANWLDLCALTLPVGRDRAGLPVGLQLMAPKGADERLLTIGLAVEAALGTGRERLGAPPLGGL